MLFGHEWYRQVIERIGRARQAQLGSGKVVQINRIVATDTVDIAMVIAQARKYGNERGFIKALHDYRAIKEMLG
jgi:hypothetical protein